jgi:ubiquinone/menaquinone biosynthesis C-methylase UbiE
MIDPRDYEAARAWTSFWAEQPDGSHCLAGAPPDMRRALLEHWRSFAARLPVTANVIDIGCGAGAVGTAVVAAVPSARVTGIDFADIPRSKCARIELRGNTSMEALPFADGSFDAAVSQFGFEYGRTDEAAAEMARVLRPGAPFSLLVHHSQSPILADLPSQKRAAEGLCGERLKAAFLSGNPSALQRVLSALQQQSPGLRIIDLAKRGLHSNVHRSLTQRVEVWKAVVDALKPERILLRAQEKGCVAPDSLHRWIQPFAEAFSLAPTSILSFRSGVPIAWRLEGSRKPAPSGVRNGSIAVMAAMGGKPPLT